MTKTSSKKAEAPVPILDMAPALIFSKAKAEVFADIRRRVAEDLGALEGRNIEQKNLSRGKIKLMYPLNIALYATDRGILCRPSPKVAKTRAAWSDNGEPPIYVDANGKVTIFFGSRMASDPIQGNYETTKLYAHACLHLPKPDVPGIPYYVRVAPSPEHAKEAGFFSGELLMPASLAKNVIPAHFTYTFKVPHHIAAKRIEELGRPGLGTL